MGAPLTSNKRCIEATHPKIGSFIDNLILFTDMNLFMWRLVLRQHQGDNLTRIGITKCMSISIQHGSMPHTSHFGVEKLRASSNGQAKRVYESIPKKYKDILQKMGKDRQELSPRRSD